MSCDRLTLPIEWLVSSIGRSGGDTVPKGFQNYSYFQIIRFSLRNFYFYFKIICFSFWNPYGNKKSYDFLGTGGISNEDFWQPFNILSEEVTKQADRSRLWQDPQYPWRFSSVSSPSQPISMQIPEMQILIMDLEAFEILWND